MHEITVQELLVKGYSNLVDVRSPGEFARESIPGAVNIPLFSNEERALVGTTYKQEGQVAAQWLGMQIVSPKMEAIMQAIRQRGEEWGEPPTIFCWRGGMRSRAMATFATFSGLRVRRLQGGYRAYRQHVLETIEPYELQVPVFLLHGMTGVGKTELLKRLEENGHPVLDLERMAGHRGSVFGHIGKGKPANQKMFDARLFETLQRNRDASLFVMEAESKRIGNAILPPFLIDAKKQAIHIQVTAPLEMRVQRIYEEYVVPFSWRPDFAEKVELSYTSIARRIPTEQGALLRDALTNRDYRSAIALLLVHYYDPRYQNKQSEYVERLEHHVDAIDLEKAVQQIDAIIEKSLPIR
ncbi:tRNA 2-selenouridine(34) synthase MnmH [Brevibacillus choshinensis]|uniref:tRNA 2-selenouridine(34) synthase MnmH n=1 Tax=Brevibacillus choshinensis TaxID=54911 RepID=UPI002E1EF9C1|nr:tRNA 2-selenouridine(34) synthase MnmH [Brevibacillus choshinensis]MED4751527.1 tRNA 2-selenouridine(34) synthase MnmH [Brevibacillus choshinensis]MED4780236.1 tRNA 2-selenouridine(34) synthase MnmH [Brevibacillus choshinensis]